MPASGPPGLQKRGSGLQAGQTSWCRRLTRLAESESLSPFSDRKELERD
ncbi:MAG: hypothetical protein MZV63_49290 [Marinilabiliales bacterium]|nr:hypothetical protein [Marinilabiliales bacterium]